jgi:uncharacterized protein YdeI (YjbR/CyaY-like superfamily)
MSGAVFFASFEEWRAWLDENHASASEITVGFHKAKSGRAGLTYRQALDGALCYGWIDGLRRGGELSWTIRFTRRRRGSIWSAINIARVEELRHCGHMHPAGLQVFETRDITKQKRYSGENPGVTLDPAFEKKFRANRKAWADFQTRPPSYRGPAIWWVMSAKREETREKRLATLIADSEAGRKIKLLTPTGERGS